jgi:glutaminyl-peptide cyclotransferase
LVWMSRTILVLALLGLGASSGSASETMTYGYKVKNTYPHDPSAFTQGLVYLDGVLYEGTGLRGRSNLRRVELESGRVLQRTDLLPMFFGEGIAVLGEHIYQLTWTSGVGFVYDKKTMTLLREFRFGVQEGWGMTHDGKSLIVSDGSPNLYYWDPETLRETKRIVVRDGTTPVERLNELEYIDGEIYANIWQEDRIARISPETGQVLAWIDLTDLLAPADRSGHEDVLNGIAYDPAGKRLFVTGKLWPKLFEIELVPRKH